MLIDSRMSSFSMDLRLGYCRERMTLRAQGTLLPAVGGFAT
ncbi:MAG TPA: hypothetical protein VGM15_07245 [Burkholderiaceae bacterium]